MRIKKIHLFLWCLAILLIGGVGFFLFTNLATKNLFLNAKADRLQEQGKFDDAIITYERLIEIEPDNGVNYWNMAVVYLQKGDEVSARKQVLALRQMNERNLSSMLEDLIERYNKQYPSNPSHSL